MSLSKQTNPPTEWPFMLRKFLTPKNDIAFKKIFGTEKNKDILIYFLNTMLVFKEKKPIVNVKFLKTVQDPEIAAHKTSILDVLCEDDIGNQYIVEMQVSERDDFVKRAQYYAARAYSSQLDVGNKYNRLKEIIFLAVTNFIMFPDKKDYKSDHVILDKNTHEHDLKDFSFTFIELKKFNIPKEQLSSIIEKWCYFFKYAESTTEDDLMEIIGNDIIIKKAYDQLNKFNWNKQELIDYDAVFKREMDYTTAMELKYDAGFAKGEIDGKLKSTKEIAIKMFKKGLNINDIAELTNLSIDDIKLLINYLAE